MSSERSMSAQKVSESSQTTIKWVAIWPHGTPAVRKNVMTVPLSHMKRFKAPENASDYENGRPYSYKPPSAEHSKFVYVLALAENKKDLELELEKNRVKFPFLGKKHVPMKPVSTDEEVVLSQTSLKVQQARLKKVGNDNAMAAILKKYGGIVNQKLKTLGEEQLCDSSFKSLPRQSSNGNSSKEISKCSSRSSHEKISSPASHGKVPSQSSHDKSGHINKLNQNGGKTSEASSSSSSKKKPGEKNLLSSISLSRNSSQKENQQDEETPEKTLGYHSNENSSRSVKSVLAENSVCVATLMNKMNVAVKNASHTNAREASALKSFIMDELQKMQEVMTRKFETELKKMQDVMRREVESLGNERREAKRLLKVILDKQKQFDADREELINLKRNMIVQSSEVDKKIQNLDVQSHEVDKKIQNLDELVSQGSKRKVPSRVDSTAESVSVVIQEEQLSAVKVHIGSDIYVDKEHWDQSKEAKSTGDWAASALLACFGHEAKLYRVHRPRSDSTGDKKVIPDKPPYIAVLLGYFKVWLNEHPDILDQRVKVHRKSKDYDEQVEIQEDIDWANMLSHETEETKKKRRADRFNNIVSKFKSLLGKKATDLSRLGVRRQSKKSPKIALNGSKSGGLDVSEASETHHMNSPPGSPHRDQTFVANNGSQANSPLSNHSYGNQASSPLINRSHGSPHINEQDLRNSFLDISHISPVRSHDGSYNNLGMDAGSGDQSPRSHSDRGSGTRSSCMGSPPGSPMLSQKRRRVFQLSDSEPENHNPSKRSKSSVTIPLSPNSKFFEANQLRKKLNKFTAHHMRTEVNSELPPNDNRFAPLQSSTEKWDLPNYQNGEESDSDATNFEVL